MRLLCLLLVCISLTGRSADSCDAECGEYSCTAIGPGFVACFEEENWAYCASYDELGNLLLSSTIECVDGQCSITSDGCPGIDPEI